MAKVIRISLTGPDDVVASSLDAFVRLNGWTDEVLGEPNPQSQVDKAREVLFGYLVDSVKFYRRKEAEAQAAAAAQAAVDALVPSTTLELIIEDVPVEEPPPEGAPPEPQPEGELAP